MNNIDYKQEYEEKLIDAPKAVEIVKSGDWIDYGWTTGTPVALDKALASRMDQLTDLNFRGGILLWVPEIFKIKDPEKHLSWNSWHMSGIERKAVDSGYGFYNPLRYSELPGLYRNYIKKNDVAMFQVAPMDAGGYFNFGPNTSHMKAVCQISKKVIVEENYNMPRCAGGKECGIHISQVDMIVKGSNPVMGQLPPVKITDVDREIAKLVVEEIPNGACLQLGIGGMSNSVGMMIAQSDLKDLGVHTEMYVDAFVDISKAGKINGSQKNLDKGRQIYAFAAGTQKVYDFLDENPECIGATVDYTNDIHNISSIDNFISINSCVDVDLFGQVNSESSGLRQISGSGGQQDFVLGAYLSNGGNSFICCSSTYKTKDGNVKSRIMPIMESGSIVTDTRANIHYLVTEFGKVNLKGLSTWQRAEQIISVAHPDFRDSLIEQAEKMNIWRQSNKRYVS